jgi:hypothetical protein
LPRAHARGMGTVVRKSVLYPKTGQQQTPSAKICQITPSNLLAWK